MTLPVYVLLCTFQKMLFLQVKNKPHDGFKCLHVYSQVVGMGAVNHYTFIASSISTERENAYHLVVHLILFLYSNTHERNKCDDFTTKCKSTNASDQINNI
jgi:hypothetical protein